MRACMRAFVRACMRARVDNFNNKYEKSENISTSDSFQKLLLDIFLRKSIDLAFKFCLLFSRLVHIF